MWDTLKRDPVVQIALGVSAALLLPFLVPVLPLPALEAYKQLVTDPPLILIAMAAFQYGLDRIPDRAVRRFWMLWTAGYGCWLAAHLTRFAEPLGLKGNIEAELLRNVLYVGLYLLVTLALQAKPHVPVTARPATWLRHLEGVGATCLILGLLIYFALIPRILDPNVYDTAVPTVLLYLVLDGSLVLTLAHLRASTQAGRWRTTYAWLLATAGLWLVADGAEVLMWAGLLPDSVGGVLMDLVWLPSFATVVVAARARDWAPAGPDEGAGQARPSPAREPGVILWGSALVLQAASLPIIHITLTSFGVLDPRTERAQEICAFAVFVIVGGLALAYQQRLEKENRQLAAVRLQVAVSEHRAYHDALTGLPNRYLLLDHLKLALAQARREKGRVAVFFLDLDRFKLINDSLGHTIGDQLLQEVATRLQRSFREADTLARLGGDELTILAQGINDAADAMTVGQKLLECMRRPFVIRRRELYVTASVGVSLYPDDGLDAETLIKNADVAVYRAKEQGGDCCELFNPAMNQKALERLALESALHKAVEENQFHLHYQPILDTASGAIDGCEALLRWQHPERGLLAPGEFMERAEVTGVITRITPWILWTACHQARIWESRCGRPVSIAVNLSARQFRDPLLVAQVEQALLEAELDPSRLELEITESLAMENAEHTVRTLKALKDLGVWISIDDFGTGYSSLSYLKAFPIDMLKIDRSFVRDIDTDAADAAIAATVIAIARTLHLRVVAEGVERPEQLAVLRERQCDRVQGYLFSRPVPAEEIAMLLVPAPGAEGRLVAAGGGGRREPDPATRGRHGAAN